MRLCPLPPYLDTHTLSLFTGLVPHMIFTSSLIISTCTMHLRRPSNRAHHPTLFSPHPQDTSGWALVEEARNEYLELSNLMVKLEKVWGINPSIYFRGISFSSQFEYVLCSFFGVVDSVQKRNSHSWNLEILNVLYSISIITEHSTLCSPLTSP